jgi:uncharacterized SAM-binding protein YcdF (DUF218 family)
MFLMKKILSLFFYPLSVCSLLLIIGLFLLWFTRRQRGGRIMVSAGAVLLLVLSYGSIPDRLLRPLENRYPPLFLSSGSDDAVRHATPAIKRIVVLGGDHVADPLKPATSQLRPTAMVRVVEAVRIYRELPGSRLVFSGGPVTDPESEVMASVARGLGVSDQDIDLESAAMDTEEEARLLQPMLGSERFILVTSAAHLPRSMALFQKLNMNPIPAPAGYLALRRQGVNAYSFFPDPDSLIKWGVVIHEYLGMGWSKLRGRI